MIEMLKKKNLLGKYGFYKTLEILHSDGKPMSLNAFYEKLIKDNGYHNQFIRIRDELLEKDIISIDKMDNSGRRMILLTGNGIILKYRVKEIIMQLENLK